MSWVGSLFLSAFLFSQPSFAVSQSATAEDGFLEIGSVEVSEIVPSLDAIAVAQASAGQLPKPGLKKNHDDVIPGMVGIIGVSDWASAGEKVWDIVSSNSASVKTQSNQISILPPSETDWTKVEGWKGPVIKSYRIQAKNKLGFEVMHMDYTVSAYYGGSIGGVGAYLSNVTIFSTDVSVMFGFGLDAHVEVGEPINVGTATEPIPGISLGLVHSFGNFLNRIESRETFFVCGDGRVASALLPIN
jgi:hypothetical protein